MPADLTNLPPPGPRRAPAPAAPAVIGVAGGSGSGTTSVVQRIVESIGGDHVIVTLIRSLTAR